MISANLIAKIFLFKYLRKKFIQIKAKQRTKMTYFICKFEEYMTWEGSRDWLFIANKLVRLEPSKNKS